MVFRAAVAAVAPFEQLGPSCFPSIVEEVLSSGEAKRTASTKATRDLGNFTSGVGRTAVMQDSTSVSARVSTGKESCGRRR